MIARQMFSILWRQGGREGPMTLREVDALLESRELMMEDEKDTGRVLDLDYNVVGRVVPAGKGEVSRGS